MRNVYVPRLLRIQIKESLAISRRDDYIDSKSTRACVGAVLSARAGIYARGARKSSDRFWDQPKLPFH